MLVEWFRALRIFIKNGHDNIKRNVNNEKYSKISIFFFYMFFVTISVLVGLANHKGFNDLFIDYIKDVFAIIVGFFVAVLVFTYEKIELQAPSVINDADNRLDSNTKLKLKQEYNYTIRFFYSVGLNIVYALIVLLMLLPNIFWMNFFSQDWCNYKFVSSFQEITKESFLLFLHNAFVILYRSILLYLVLKVYFYTIYSVASIMQVFINKKKK